MDEAGEIRLSKDEIEKLLFPYKGDHVYLREAAVNYERPTTMSLSATCVLPLRSPTYLNKQIDYITATEGLGLVTRSFILMYVVALNRQLLPELHSLVEDICKDPEVMTLSVVMNCKKRILRNSRREGGESPSEREVSVKVWLKDGWSVRKRRDRKAFQGTVAFQLEGDRWDGHVDTFIWLE